MGKWAAIPVSIAKAVSSLGTTVPYQGLPLPGSSATMLVLLMMR